MDYVTIPDVELVTVGMDWPGANGPLTFTFEHLADAEAAIADPHIRLPRIKIGHSDPRFWDGIPDHDPFYDGEPAFGQVANLRLVNDGAVLVGDFIEVPAWLAEAMPSSYPSRSIEGAYLDGRWDVTTPGEKHYSFVLTAVAALGVYLPAVEDLEDLQRVLTSGEGLVVTGGAATAGRIEGVKPEARADIDKVIRTFYAEVADGDAYWHWVRSVWTDPNELIVDDDNGGLYRLPFNSADDQTISFGDPVEVLETFVDVASGQTAAAAAAVGHADQRPIRTFASRAAAGEIARREGGARPAGSNSLMDVDRQVLAARLGLDADATDEQINAALASAPESQPAPEEETPPATPAPGEPAQGDPSAPGSEEPADDPSAPQPDPVQPDEEDDKPDASAETVTVDRETWERTQQGARAGVEARTAQLEARRDDILDRAVKAGKFPPSRVQHYRDLWSADAAGTEELIDKLQPGLVPVNERGTSKASELGNTDELALAMSSFGGRHARAVANEGVKA